MFAKAIFLKKNSVIFVLLFLMDWGVVHAQEMLGISNSNYAGNMGMEMNPSHMVVMPYKWEINFLSGDIFVQNDYLYFPAGHVPLGKLFTFQAINKEDWSDHYTPPPKNLYGHLFLKGPSIIWQKNDHAFGIHTALRMEGSAEDVDFHLAKFIWEGFSYAPQHGIELKTDPYQAALAAWAELGFSYGKILFENEKSQIAGAATLNGNLGLDGFYIQNKNMDYILPSSDTLIIHNLNAVYAHSMPEDKDKDAPKVFSPRGYGCRAEPRIQLYTRA